MIFFIRDRVEIVWFGTSAYSATMKLVLTQVRFYGINFKRPNALKLLQYSSRTKGRVAMAHKWVLAFCDANEKNELTNPSFIRSPGTVDYDILKTQLLSPLLPERIRGLETRIKADFK